MTTLQKTLIVVTLSAAIGTASYEEHQTSQLLEQIQTLRQQQVPVVEQIRQLQHERDEAAKRVASFLEENAQLRSGSHAAEIQKLRGNVARLEAVAAQQKTNSNDPVVSSWLDKVNQLKQYATQHPGESSPEFNYLTDREWLLLAAHGGPGTDFAETMKELKSQAAGRFAQVVQTALQDYAAANNGQFPRDFSQLNPYCDAGMEEILQQHYEIKPASILPANSANGLDIKTDWVIAGKEPVASNTADHIAIYTNGYTYFW